jgi:hypothetical protein
MGNQFANSQSIDSSGPSEEHGGTLAPRRKDHPTITLSPSERTATNRTKPRAIPQKTRLQSSIAEK